MSTSNGSGWEPENVQQGLRLLSFDGGGIKGLSALIILEHLMFKLKGDATNIPLPCDYFEMIAGTSTGGLIALMLGRLRMSVQEAITAYEKLAGHVFSSTNMLGDGKFKASILEQAIKDIVKERTNNENSTLLDGGELGGICNTFVCAMNAHNMNARIPTIFRTYESKELPIDCTIWEAGRATSAAPTFFERIRIGDTASAQSYIDGGMGNNNPTKLLLGEANLMFPGRHIACVVSMGTGHPDTIANSRTRSLKRFLPGGLDNLYKVVVALKGIATDSENIHQELARRFSDVHDFYFRFNVDQGMEKIKLSEYEKLSEVRAHTEQYLKMHQPKKSLSDVVRVMNARDRRLSTAAANNVIQSETAILIPDNHITEDKMHREDNTLLEYLPGARELHHDGHRLGSCLDKTRTKFLADVNEWISDLNGPPIGWLHGPAGYGKSTVARSIAAQRPSAEFYFSRGNVNRSKPDFVFGSLAWQLANLYPSLKGRIVKAADSEFKRTPPPLEDQPNHLILKPLSENEKDLTNGVFILIDAIDECQTDRKRFLNLIPELGNMLPSFVKLLLVSRLDDDIARVMRNTKHIPFDIAHAPNTDEDIKLYITTELDKIGISDQQKIEALVDRAHGLFIWAALACGYIEGDSDARIQELLVKPNRLLAKSSESSENLHTMYELVLEKAKKEGGFDHDDFRAVIGTIASVQRPCPTLVLDELLDVDACSIEPTDFLRPSIDTLSSSKKVTDRLSSLLTVTTTSIEFFHSSVYEFVLEYKPTNFGVGADLNAGISYRCFTIMIHLLKRDICGIDDPTQLNAEVEGLDTKLKEFVPEPLEYACIFWAGHLQDAAADQKALDVMDRFFRKQFLHWVEVMSLLGQMGRVYPALETARSYIRKFSQSSSRLNDLIDECLWFINEFREPIEQIAAQVYYSGMAFVPNESSLWTTYAPMIADLRLPNVISGRMTRVPPKPRRHFTADMQPLAVSPIGTLVVYTMNSTLHAWSVEEEHEIPTPGIERSAGSLKDTIFGYDGTFLVIVQSSAVFAWKVEGTTFNRMKPTILRNAAQDSVFVSQYQPHVAIIQKSTCELCVRDLRTGRNRVERKKLDIIEDYDEEFSLQFFGCDEYIAINVPPPSRRELGALFILNISTGTIKPIPDVDSVEVSLYSTVAAVTGGNKCRLMDLVDMRSFIDVTKDFLHISSHATYAWLGGHLSQQESFRIWRRESGSYVECSPILDTDQDQIYKVVFSEDERKIGCFFLGACFACYDLAPEPQFAFRVRSDDPWHVCINNPGVAFSQRRSYIALRLGSVTQVLDRNSGAIKWTSTIPNWGDLVLSPNGTHVLAVGHNTVDVVNSVTGVTTSQHEDPPSSIPSAIIPGDVCAVSLSADGKHLLTGSRSGAIQTWDVNPSRLMQTVGSTIDFGQHVTSVVYGHGERKIFAVIGPPWSLGIRYAHDGAEVRPPIVVGVESKSLQEQPRIMGISHNDELIAVSSPDGILLINSATGRVWRSWLGVPNWVCIISGTETLFVWKNGVAGIFDEKLSLVRHFPTLPPRHIETVVFSDDCSTMLLVSNVELTEIVDIAAGVVSRLPSSTVRCEGYTISGDGKRVCGEGLARGIKCVWESATGRLLSWTFGHGRNLKMSWDGRIVAWIDGGLHVWDINEHKTKVLLYPESLSPGLNLTSSIMLSDDGSTLIQTLQRVSSMGWEKPMYGYVIFDTTSGQPFQSRSIPRNVISTYCLSGSNDVIIVHGDGIDIISRVTFERRHCPLSVDSATFSADGRFLSMWRNTLKIRLISLPSGTCLRESRIQDGVDLSGIDFFSDDQNVIATLRIREVECAQQIIAWENDTLGLPGWEASGPLENDYPFRTIAYSSDWSSAAMWNGKTIIVTRLERGVLVQHSIVPESRQVDDLVLSTPGIYLTIRVGTLVDIYDVSITSKRLHRLNIFHAAQRLVFCCPETKSTNAKLLVKYGDARDPSVLDVVTGKSLKLPFRSTHIQLSDDGMRIASRDDGEILLFNVAEWCTIRYRKYNGLNSFSFSRDSRWLLIRHGIFSDILNTRDGSVVHESIPCQYYNIVTFAFSTDGTKLAVVEREDSDHESLMDTKTLSETAPDSFASLVSNPDGRLHTQTTVQSVLSALNIQSGHCQDLILSEGVNIDRPQFSHDRTRIGCIVNGHLRSFPTLSTLRNIRENGPGDVCCFTFAASTNDVAFGCIDGKVGLQSPSPNDVSRMSVPVEHRIESIAFICNDQKLLSITDDGVIHSWDCKALDSPQQLHVVYPRPPSPEPPLIHHRGGVGLALSPDHRHVAVFYYGGHLLLSVSDGVPQTVDKGVSHRTIHSASFSPDSRFLLWIASEASDLWDLETKHVEQIKEGLSVKGCAWSPDSSNLVLNCHGVGFIQLGLHHTPPYPSHLDISYLEDFNIQGNGQWLTIETSPRTYSGAKKLLWIYEGLRLLDTSDGFILMEKVNTYERMVVDLRNYLSQPTLRSRFILCDSSIIVWPVTPSSMGGLISRRIGQAIVEMAVVSAHTDEYKLFLTNPPEILC